MTRRLPALALAVLLPLTACSSDPEPDTAAAPAASPSASAPVASATAAAPSAPSATSSVAPATAPSAPAPAEVTASRSAAPAAPAAPAPSAAAAPDRSTAPGSYTYDADGTVTVGTPQPVDGEAVLTVDPVAAGQQHSVLEGEQGRTEQDVVLRDDGRYLALLSITNPAFSKTFRPEPAVLLLPSPAEPGRRWSWTATSTDGRTTASASNRVAREEVLTVGGQRVPCAVVETTLVLSGDIDYRGVTTTWVSLEHALPVRDRSRGEGTVSGFAFSTDITTTLRSVDPA